MEFAEKLITLRKSRELTQEQLAEQLNVSRQSISKWESGQVIPEVEKIIEKRGGKLLEKYNLFDIYEGAQIKEGFKSVAYTISFRAKDRTLEDKDIQPIMEKILEDLSGMGIELRS